MANQRRKFTPEFKQEIIKLITEQGKPVGQVARDIEVNESVVRRWVKTYTDEGIKGCITCWGTPSFTDDLLVKAERLKFIAHAAGSIKNLAPKSFWSTGCRITSNAQVIAEDVAQTTLAFILCSFETFMGLFTVNQGRKLEGWRIWHVYHS